MKILRFRKTFLFFILPVLIFLTGCSPTSNTIRYGSGDNDKEEKEPPVRYGKNEKSIEDETLVDNEDNDESPDDLTTIDVSVFTKKYSSLNNSSKASTLKEKMLMEIIRYMNTPYKFGGISKDGIDCSAFTQTVFKSCSLELLRSARDQYTQGIMVDKKEDLKFGDLVFFNTRKNVKPGHVGIYIGDSLFVHASSKHGVIVTPLTHEYYLRNYMGARRIDSSLSLQ